MKDCGSCANSRPWISTSRRNTTVTFYTTADLNRIDEGKKLDRTFYTVIGLCFFTSISFPSPATFVTALPVARDQLLIRLNAQPTFSTRSFYGVQFPVNVGYGLTSRWALFLNVNQGFGAMSGATTLGHVDLSSAGFGDMATYARYTLFKIDKPKSTFRIAPLAGAF